MPQVTVYIRAEDYEQWRAIEKKSEWIHTQLGAGGSRKPFITRSVLSGAEMLITIPPTPVEQNILDSLPVVKASDIPTKLCTHGANPRFCKHAKNGKPCK